MAVEVVKETYYFTTRSEAAFRQRVVVKQPSFVYNPLHDIESLWWVLLWVVLCKVPSATSPGDQDAIHNHCDAVLDAFPQRLGEGDRPMLMKMDSAYIYHRFEGYMMPPMARYLFHVLSIQDLLVDSYTKAEVAVSTGGDINPTAWLTIHQNVTKVIDGVFKDMECGDLTLFHLATALQNAMKHKKAQVEG